MQAMQTQDFFIYIFFGLVALYLYMLRKDKPKLPTALEMKDFSRPKSFKQKQLTGAKPVQAKVVSAEIITDDESATWASPTLLVDGKPKDAYSLLGLESGVPMNQVRAHVALLLQGKNTPAKIDIIKRAYQAIVDANIS